MIQAQKNVENDLPLYPTLEKKVKYQEPQEGSR